MKSTLAIYFPHRRAIVLRFELPLVLLFGWTWLCAQTPLAGKALAYNHGQWQMIAQTSVVQPLKVGTPLAIVDGISSKELTPTAIQCAVGSSSCSFTASFSLAHPGRFQIANGRAGLQEAINDLVLRQGGTGLLTPKWSGATSFIAKAQGTTDMLLENIRSGQQVWYMWDGINYQTTMRIGNSVMSDNPDLDLKSPMAPIGDLTATGPWVDVRAFGASGSLQTTTVNCVAGSSAVSLAAPIDFSNGQGIGLTHCGFPTTLPTPTPPTVQLFATASPGQDFNYSVAAVDAQGGVSAASAATIVTGAATRQYQNGSIFAVLTWPSITGAHGYAIYGGPAGGAQHLLALVPAMMAQLWAATTRYAVNQLVAPTVYTGHYYRAVTFGTSGSIEPDWCLTSGCTVVDGAVTWREQSQRWIDVADGTSSVAFLPSSPPAAPLADTLWTTISNGSGSAQLTLGTAALATTAHAVAYHYDGFAFRAAVAAAMQNGSAAKPILVPLPPSNSCFVVDTLQLAPNQFPNQTPALEGEAPGSTLCQPAEASGTLLDIAGPVANPLTNNVKLSDLKLACGPLSSDCLMADRVEKPLLSNVLVVSGTSDGAHAGIRLDDMIHGALVDSGVSVNAPHPGNVSVGMSVGPYTFSNPGVGLILNSGSQANALIGTQWETGAIDGLGIWDRNGGQNAFIGGTVEDNNSGVVLDASGDSFIDCRCYANPNTYYSDTVRIDSSGNVTFKSGGTLFSSEPDGTGASWVGRTANFQIASTAYSCSVKIGSSDGLMLQVGDCSPRLHAGNSTATHFLVNANFTDRDLANGLPATILNSQSGGGAQGSMGILDESTISGTKLIGDPRVVGNSETPLAIAVGTAGHDASPTVFTDPPIAAGADLWLGAAGNGTIHLAGGCSYNNTATCTDIATGTAGGASPHFAVAGNLSVAGTGTLAALTLGSDTVHSLGRQLWPAFFPGSANQVWTGSMWTPGQAILIDRVQAQAKTAPVGCTTAASIQITKGASILVSIALTSATADSGHLKVAVSSGTTIALQITAARCTTVPADVQAIVEYKMQ